MTGDAPTRYRTRSEVVRRRLGDRLWVLVADRDDDPLELAGAAAVLVTAADGSTTIAAVVERFALAPDDRDAAWSALVDTTERLVALGVLEPCADSRDEQEPDRGRGPA